MPPGFDPRNFLYLGGVGVIVGIVSIFKLWISDTRWYPVIAVVFGIGINLLLGWYLGVAWQECIIAGLIAGMAAGGVYSYASTLKEGRVANKKNRAASQVLPARPGDVPAPIQGSPPQPKF